MSCRASRLLLLLAASVALLGALAPVAGAAGNDARSSVVKGTTGSIAELPWLAYIEVPGGACTGTVIAPRLVLTAAHCVHESEGSGRMYAPAALSVTTGVADLKQRGAANVVGVAQALVFPGYDPLTGKGDAGLLVTAAPLAAPAIPLLRPGQEVAPGTAATIAGWGLTGAPPRQPPTVLREGVSTVQSPTTCTRTVRRFSPTYLPAWQLCLSDQPRQEVSGCMGDSGGPGIVAGPGGPVQIGVISYGRIDCDARHPSVLTRVDKVVGWVDSWVLAVETGGPAPRVFTPRVRPLRLPIPQGKQLIAEGLALEFGPRFTRQRFGELSGCRRIEAEKIKCAVEWVQGGDYYFGTATPYLTTSGGATIWNLRYVIRRVRVKCVLSGRTDCSVWLKRR